MYVPSPPSGPAAITLVSALRIGITLVALLASIWQARRAERRTANVTFTLRVLAPAFAFSASFTLLLFVGDSDRGAWAVLLLFSLLLVGVSSILLILLIELIVRRLRPSRSRAWLAIALGLFIPFFMIPPTGLVAWFAPQGIGNLLQWDILEIVTLVTATALLWWSYLPPRPVELADIFR